MAELTPAQEALKNVILEKDPVAAACAAEAAAKLMPDVVERMKFFQALNGQHSADGNKQIEVQQFARGPSETGAAHDYFGQFVDVRDRSQFVQFPPRIYEFAIDVTSLTEKADYKWPQPGKCQ